ncbi:helix-turn-helix domain-containing protein [Streptomyces collinus]|uniref:helix-turn-helix domain-containing protein n=1 Tax=Streptomyces collinus TaxID=42684 RepID=UPI003630F7FC
MRRVRLAHAHHDLVAADPDDGTTVTGIAARWGFHHAGRFAAEYRETYGRAPHRTPADG